MTRLNQIAAMAVLSFGRGMVGMRERYNYSGEASPRGIVFGQPRLANFTSERPLTKRQKRRLRGKGAHNA